METKERDSGGREVVWQGRKQELWLAILALDFEQIARRLSKYAQFKLRSGVWLGARRELDSRGNDSHDLAQSAFVTFCEKINRIFAGTPLKGKEQTKYEAFLHAITGGDQFQSTTVAVRLMKDEVQRALWNRSQSRENKIVKEDVKIDNDAADVSAAVCLRNLLAIETVQKVLEATASNPIASAIIKLVLNDDARWEDNAVLSRLTGQSTNRVRTAKRQIGSVLNGKH